MAPAPGGIKRMKVEQAVPRPFWNTLTEPHAALTGPVERRRARVLSGISLALLAGAAALAVWAFTRSPGAGYAALPPAALFLVVYALSRTPRAPQGALLLVLGLLIGNFVVILREPDAAQVAEDIPFLLLPILLAALLLNARLAGALAAAVVIGLLALPLALPWLSLADYLPGFAANAIVAILAALMAFLRERDMALIQNQTADLTRYTRTLEAEVRNVITTAQVGQAITGMRNLSDLLRQIVTLIVERFDFYHAQVFLLDDAREFAVLRESTGEPGRELLARGHRLPVGSQSVIGQVAAQGKPLIVLDTDTNPVHRRNDLLPNTRSEMALPLVAGGQLIGVLDIQSARPNAFSESDLRVFQTMADQLAVAIENARLFERTQRDLDEIEKLNRRLTGEGWMRYQASRPGGAAIGYQAGPDGARPIRPGELPAGDGQEAGALSLPLMVRGEPIGVLDVRSRSGEPLDEQAQAVLQAVAERVALALDSTRLGDSALRQVEREQLLGRLSAELQATTDLDVILHIAAREASRALGTPRGFVHLAMKPRDEPAPPEQG